jgi:ribonucleotide monophosphatase NagD (HAD superfamily)
MGKQLLFVTNNASKSRAGYVGKFKSFGLDVEPAEVIREQQVPAQSSAAVYT